MVNRSAIIGLGLGAWLSASLLSGCNEVLDIEEAHLDTSGSASVVTPPSSTGIQYYPDLDTCIGDVTSDCAMCIQSTAPCTSADSTSASPAAALQKCQLDKACRKSMAQYSACLGQDCQGNGGKCFEQGLFNPLSSPVDACLDGCGDKCAHSPLLTTLQLYCGCMMKNCSGKFTSPDDCTQKNRTEYSDTLVCRWTHCEIAPDDPSGGHCEHGIGMLGNCADGQVPKRSADCRDKSLASYYCKLNSDCCSGNCDTGRNVCL